MSGFINPGNSNVTNSGAQIVWNLIDFSGSTAAIFNMAHIEPSNSWVEGGEAGKPEPAEAAPTPIDTQKIAAENAQNAITSRRRSILASGGGTDITGGSGQIGGESTQRPTILGA